MVSSIGAWSYTPTEVGVFGVSMDLDPIRVSEAVRLVAREVRMLALEGPGSDELERARILLRAQWARRFESADGRAMELAAAQTLEDVTLLDREYQRLREEVTRRRT